MDPEPTPDQKEQDFKPHWQNVKDNCQGVSQLEPECIEAFYDALDKENGVEWYIALEGWFNNQLTIALFGLPISWFALLSAFYFLIYPDRVPNIADAPWDDVEATRGLMIMIVTATANLVKPDLFFLTQLITGGQSDLRDFELIFMDPYDAVLYFFMEGMLLPFMQLFSFIFVATFWWLYAAELFWIFYQILVSILIPVDWSSTGMV